MRAILFAVILVLSTLPGHSQSRQARANCAESIQKHVKQKLAKEGQYKVMHFGSLVVDKPKEYLELEELEKLSAVLPEMKQHYKRKKLDSLIQQNELDIQNKKREIMTNNIRVSYELEHTFLIKDKTNQHTAYRYNFFLDHQYNITDVRSRYVMPLNSEQAEDFYYFQKHLPIYDLAELSKNQEASNEIYTFFETALEETKYEEAVMHASLRTIRNIRNHGTMDLDKYGQRAIRDWIEANRPDMKGYKKEDFSYMLEIRREIQGQERLIGYKMFHKYSYKDADGKRIEDVVYFEFDTYFVIRGVLRVEAPYDEYFKKE